VLAIPAQAQPFVYEARTLIADEVEIRCGPSLSANYYATTKLRRGDVVEVATNKQTEPGWLAIKPPKGSYSWIRAQLVRQDTPNGGTVVTDGSPVLAGSSMMDKAPSVRTAHLQRGAQVVVLGKPLVCSDGSRWLPIEPHLTEVRYIPVSAVSTTGALQTVAAKPAGPVAANGAGNVQLGNPTVGTGAAGAGGTTLPNGQYGQAPAVAPGQWSAVGWLRKSNFKNDDGTAIYWFYNSQNQFVHYVVGQAGANLDQHLSQWVYLFGQKSFREFSGIRADFMTVGQVQMAK
jgi:hypothetical protein